MEHLEPSGHRFPNGTAPKRLKQAGSRISGDTNRIVVVKTNPGVRTQSWTPRTGKVVAQVC
jgi:hypothetical protein